jgi:uncharacterized protein YjlB
MDLQKGDEIFLPAGVSGAKLYTKEHIALMLSHPPGAQHEF